MFYTRSVIYIIIMGGLFCSSCDSWLGVNITKKSQMEKFCEKIKEFIEPESQIHEMRFISADERSQSVMGSVIITFTNPKETETLRQKIVELSSWIVLKDEKIKNKKQNISGIPAGIMWEWEYDFSHIPRICKDAIQKVNAEGMKYAGIEYFTIVFENESTNPIYEFVIDGRPENTPITTKGRFAGVYYYEVSFKTDKAGHLQMKVGDKLKVRRGGL